MATKLKKRRPGITFLLFLIAITVLIICSAKVATSWNANSATVASDYKNTQEYRLTIGRLLNEASARAVGGEAPQADAAMEAESTNISWFLQSKQGVQSHGIQAATKEEFLAAVRANSTLGGVGSGLNSADTQGDYAHLLVFDANGLYEEKVTRLGQSVTSGMLARSAYGDVLEQDLARLIAAARQEGFTVCIAVRAEQRLDNTGSIYTAYYNWYQTMIRVLYIACSVLACLLLLFIVLLRFRSRAIGREGIARVMGKLWFEVKLAVTALAMYFGALACGALYFGDPVWDSAYLLMLLASFWWCWLVLVDLRVNRGAFWRHNSVTSIVRGLRSLESRYPFLERMKRRAALLLCAETLILLLMLASMVWGTGGLPVSALLICIVLAALGFALILLFVYQYNRSMDELGLTMNYAHEIRTGAAPKELALPPRSDFIPLADDLTCIHGGISTAMEERLRSEKMKAELVTNVSHDLKTPLTSIINYIGLLDKEELSPPHTNAYVDILSQKAQRLSHLVQDLFEVSRANSGAVEMCPERLDVAALVEQTIAEMDERTQRAGVEIKTQFATRNIYALADGRQLHRVFENLLGNALKYSLSGTRVYISACETAAGAEISFKNVAGYEMNFTAQDIVERFQRGDTARATEGSGLGLAIAKSFVELNGGAFSVELDGDLFKVTVLLPPADAGTREELSAGREALESAAGIAAEHEMPAPAEAPEAAVLPQAEQEENPLPVPDEAGGADENIPAQETEEVFLHEALTEAAPAGEDTERKDAEETANV